MHQCIMLSSENDVSFFKCLAVLVFDFHVTVSWDE